MAQFALLDAKLTPKVGLNMVDICIEVFLHIRGLRQSGQMLLYKEKRRLTMHVQLEALRKPMMQM